MVGYRIRPGGTPRAAPRSTSPRAVTPGLAVPFGFSRVSSVVLDEDLGVALPVITEVHVAILLVVVRVIAPVRLSAHAAAVGMMPH